MAGGAGKYRLEGRLGGGGMAEVFAGTMEGAAGFSRRVAIKRVLPGYSNNPAFAKMFVAEAQLSAQLVHPNIVSVLDFDRDEKGVLFLVMELVEGRDLHALCATGLLPIPVVIYIIVEVLRGLGYAHDLPLGGTTRGIVHRDISPHNVLLSWEGEVKVSDFGLAKARDASRATASEMLKGKPAYMSPEQANGQALDGRSDLFSVGVMLWEMLTGQRLFGAEDTRATLAAVLFGKVPKPRLSRPEVPKDLERVVMKLLERDVSARYRSAEVAIQDLLICIETVGGREHLMTVLRHQFASVAPASAKRFELAFSQLGLQRQTQRRGAIGRIVMFAALCVVLAALGLGVASFARSHAATRVPDATSQFVDIAIVGDAVMRRPPVRRLPALPAGPLTAAEQRRAMTIADDEAAARGSPLDARGFPDACTQYAEALLMFSMCSTISASERARYAGALKDLLSSLRGVGALENTEDVRNSCIQNASRLNAVDVDCSTNLGMANAPQYDWRKK